MNTNRKVAEEESDKGKMIHHLHQQQYQSKNHVFLPKPITYLSESFGKFCTCYMSHFDKLCAPILFHPRKSQNAAL